ncbi:hypothetical protein BUALT_Bualt02G0026000 [Buddleja alternifolia]|uniref:Myb/SANT-like domain-containing protein n=1 Tax=Buddleja alternifolia TaxID=168488 RepID=A0AAV6Y411_9LAMI|nr:hypothetical protein BUALT_Bualt02G0026000 [Buddleja alternifolia]
MKGGATNPSTAKGSRRCWTFGEEKALAKALKDLLVRGYKADNGFKSGYQNLLEKAMVQAFPGTSIKAEPHINSRIHVWRKNYATISTMLNRSGFGWNDATNMIVVDSEAIWNNFVKTDSNARTMRFKSWPLYKDWVEIFEKDRATGEEVEGFPDVVQQLFNNENLVDTGKGIEEEADFEEVQSMSFSQANTDGSTKTNSKRKRKITDENDDGFINLMSSFCDKMDERLGDISRRIGFEHDVSLSRKVVYEAIGAVCTLGMEDMILVSQLILNNTENMDLFFSLPNDGRVTMVNMMLEGKPNGNEKSV